MFTVRRSFAKGRLKNYAKTARSRRRIPLRAKVIDALNGLPGARASCSPRREGGRINIDNFRPREWAPALKAAGSSTGGSTTCATRSRRGASRRA